MGKIQFTKGVGQEYRAVIVDEKSVTSTYIGFVAEDASTLRQSFPNIHTYDAQFPIPNGSYVHREISEPEQLRLKKAIGSTETIEAVETPKLASFLQSIFLS